ncbi:MAG: alcohol dehydrogenase catalytic domain-containing protein [Chloroflexi bacterium]|nr:alcohol dehydrogenase catalytic domain-containing protein [Chloroflexota bacterium]
MKAWRLLGFGDHQLMEVPLPAMEDGHVLVKVKVVQPSVTDAEVIKGTVSSQSSRLIPRLLAEGKPVQRGHEYCGEVVAAGQGVTSLQIGDRVCSPGEVYCGSCSMCRSGKYSECSFPQSIGGDIPGAFAEYMCIPERGAVKVPEAPTDNEVAALQPLSSSIGSVHSAEIRMGDVVVVLGQGPIGLGIIQAAILAGAGLTIACARRPESIELSRRFGADIVLNPNLTDVVEEVKSLTAGSGADIVFDAAGGNPEHGLSGDRTVLQAFQMVRPSGKVIQSAVLAGKLELDTAFMKRRKIRYIHPAFGTVEFLRLAGLWVGCGRIQVRPQITHVLKGLAALQEAIAITENKAKYRATNPAQVVVC